ncbi:MAG: LysM peptidoglycan-binding domain-containing protein [Bacilli bacterium]|nr:LysM peptidoglycan-binding domain-containing protein [Bacilli bacterium]
MQKVIINPSYGGVSSGIISNKFIEKDFNLELAKSLQTKLNNLGITSYLIREDDSSLTNQNRLNKINTLINKNDEVIILTFEIIDSSNNESGAKVIYALRDNDTLARDITSNLENIGLTVIKYYQLRDPNNTNLDFYELIKEPSTSSNLILSLGNPSNSFDNNFLLTNVDKIATAIASAINTYFASSNIYIVQRGDTLYSIASKFNITVDELKKANNLTSNAIIVGNELIIPSPSELDNNLEGLDEEDKMYINYTVKKGDSLYSIASNYNTSVDIIKDINNLTSNTLQVNQILKIPTSSTSSTIDYNNYTVVKGDSWYSIAKKFNTTVNTIIDLNNLTNNNLSIGQILKIPNTEGTNEEISNYTTYTVKKGDSLYTIASNYNTSINAIKDLNNLTSNILSIGQVLQIPLTSSSASQNNYTNYTVKSGDSLYRIAIAYNTTVDKIKSFNNLTSNNLSIGQVLKIPLN